MTPPAPLAAAATASIDAVVSDSAVVTFDVLVPAPSAEAPRVSLRPARGARGVVDIIGVQERARAPDGTRVIAFSCEAERGAEAYDVDVVVDRPGRALVQLTGPHIPAAGEP